MDAPVLILYGSQTGNAQDVAERLGREAQLLLFRPRVMAMDSYDITQLPTEKLVLFVASTTGQGDPPDNMKKAWRFLLRKSLPPGSLAGLHMAVFGLGDSGYPQYNVMAKKLARRLEGLGATPIVPLGMGDDQHPSGYEAGLDAWVSRVWPAARAVAGPLPAGVEQPQLTASSLLQLGQPKFRVTYLGGSGTAQGQALDTSTATTTTSSSQGGCSPGDAAWQEAVAAGVAFRRVALAASGCPLPPEALAATAGGGAQGPPSSSGSGAKHGPWCPFFAPVLANRRITAESHFQDTRHLELGLAGSGLAYEPGDVLAVLPRTPAAAVDALLARLGLDGSQRVRISPNTPAPSGPSNSHPASDQGQGQGQGEEAGVVAEGTIRAFLQGALDIAGASPRRYFFQVLQHFAPPGSMEEERLAYFATAEGRDDLYRYNQREGRTVLEVLQDFKTATPPLEWLLEACPALRPRLFSISSSLRMHPGEAHLTVGVVEYTTPYKRKKRGLCSTYLASLKPGHASTPGHASITENGHGTGGHAAGDRVAVWVERGALRMPASMATPLILIGPGTGIAPFRSFLEERHALAVQAAPPQAVQAAQPQAEAGQGQGQAAPAPCFLFFGCRGQAVDYYYREQWQQMQAAGVLDPGPMGLVTAFSRDQASKVYVTHKLREQGAGVWSALQQGACVYVSGSAQKMPAGVVSALQDVAQEHGGLAKEEAAKYVKQLELGGRYFVEAWS